LISACGNINKPGIYEIDMTISVEEFIYSDEYCGGIANGKKLKACIPGGIISAHSACQFIAYNCQRRKKADEL
jgi:NADH:ubiquinone oxidoreductase subunit F (NADH-binding)